MTANGVQAARSRKWGLTASRIKTLESLRKNEAVQESVGINALYQHTKIYVRHARDLARSGQRDAARDWHRYFVNSGVVSLISRDGSVAGSLVSELAKDIQQLGLECHPEENPDWQTDIEAIRASLEEIKQILTADVSSGRVSFQDDRQRTLFDV